MEELELVLLSEEHLASVAALERSCFAEPWSAAALRILLAPENFGVVLLRQGQAVAYGGMTAVLDEGSVTNLATHPDFRRLGYGRRVLDALLREAGTRGLRQVFLEVRVSNDSARGLYEQAGFVSLGTRRGFYRFPTEDALVMGWSCPDDWTIE